MKHPILLAQQIGNPLAKDQTAVTAPQAFISKVVSNLITLMFIVGILYFIWHFFFAAYHLIGATSDPKKLESARTEFEYSVIGLIAMFSVFVVLKVLGLLFGIQGLDTLNLSLPTL
jgi:heme O synthase-like polyprenyltransferase